MRRKILVSVWWGNVKENRLRIQRRRPDSNVKMNYKFNHRAPRIFYDNTEM